MNKSANHHTPLRTAQPEARAAQPEGCVALCASLGWGAPRPEGCVARAIIGGTRPKRCRTTRKVRRSTQLSVLRVRQRETHNPDGGSLRMLFGVARVRWEAATPSGCANRPPQPENYATPRLLAQCEHGVKGIPDPPADTPGAAPAGVTVDVPAGISAAFASDLGWSGGNAIVVALR